MMTITQQAQRLFDMAHEKDCADSAALDIEAVLRFMGGPVSGTWHVSARTVVHWAHTLEEAAAVKEIAIMLKRAQGLNFVDQGARA